MKKITFIILAIFFSIPLSAQNSGEQIIVQLTHPGKSGVLTINHFKGLISIVGYEGDVLIIEAIPGRITDKLNGNSNGLKRISTSYIKLDAVEKNNDVTVTTNSESYTIDLNIQVPINFSLNLTNNDYGKITVNNVNGEIVINNVNGDINLYDVSGSALLNTVDGNIIAEFIGVTPNIPMAFTTLDGDIDITLPANVVAVCKMITELGEILSDFEMNIEKRKVKTEKSDKTGIKRTYLDKWTYGKINGGGPEFLFKCHDGDIIIRRSENK